MRSIIFTLLLVSIIPLDIFCQIPNGSIQVVKWEVHVKRVSNFQFEIALPHGEKVEIRSDSVKKTSMLVAKLKTVNLLFYIVWPYIGRVYLASLLGEDTLIVESYFEGASGLSANIINVSLIFFKEGRPAKLISYNSFHRGVEAIYLNKGQIDIGILDIADRSKNLFCETFFNLNETGLKPDQFRLPRYLKETKRGLITVKSREKCLGVNEPFVMVSNFP